MKSTFRKSMIWLHTYTGLLLGWLLYAVFLTGTLSYYNQELTHWMEPVAITQQHQTQLLSHGLKIMNQQAPNAARWQIQLPDDRGTRYQLSYGSGRDRETIHLDANAAVPIDEPQTRGGNFFRTFHYTLSLRQWGGRYLTGIVAMAMLIAVFTGIYTHRRFFKDFFTLRERDKNKFTVDFHAISGVITIPFCFVICFSALLIYINMYQPFAIKHHFESYRALDREVSTRHQPMLLKGDVISPNLDINTFTPKIQQKWGQQVQLTSLTVNNPSDSNAQYIFSQSKQNILSNKAETLAFTRNGLPLADIEEERLARMVRRVFYGLHEAHFASPTLRAILFTLGMFSTILIATGMVIWLQKRQAKKSKSVYTLVERVNLAAFYGLSLAVANYLLCSKLPILSITPMQYELQTFFYTWLGSLLIALLLPSNKARFGLFSANAVGYSLLVGLGLYELVTDPAISFNFAFLTITFWLTIAAIYFSLMSFNQIKQHKVATQS